MFISWFDFLFYCVLDFCFLLFVMIICAIVKERKKDKKTRETEC